MTSADTAPTPTIIHPFVTRSPTNCPLHIETKEIEKGNTMTSSSVLLTWIALAFLVSSSIGWSPATNFRNPPNVVHRRRQSNSVWLKNSSEENSSSRNDDVQTKEPSSTPILNGKRVLPFKVMTGGLKGHKVAAVYAVLNSSYKRGYVNQSVYFAAHGFRLCAFLRALLSSSISLWDV